MARIDHNLRGAASLLAPRFSDLRSDVDVPKWKIVIDR
jgi:hypothetical protein